jgi:uncharacterized Fe-S cluster-containing radical SAM superfamily protein
MPDGIPATTAPLDPRKFLDPAVTLGGETRASVALEALRTLWFNTGTLCNLTCRNCYIESSPHNDQLVYLSLEDVTAYLDEITALDLPTAEIGFTGGEPFMNPEIIGMLETCLARGFRVLVLTNAMRPMMKLKAPLCDLKDRYGERLILRVSLDHYSRDLHQLERGPSSWQPTLDGLQWLSENGFALHVAGRTYWGEDEAALRAGYARLFAEWSIAVDAFDPIALLLFPEMDASVDVPEITAACWDLLGVSPDAMMCAGSRMVIKACTLLPYDEQFEMGHRLADAGGAVKLNHPHCAKFCVLGGGSCSKS